MTQTICKFILWMSMMLFVGCTSQKQIAYLQDLPEGYKHKGNNVYAIKIRPDDMISIMVNSKDNELVQMLNLHLVSYMVSSEQKGQHQVLGYQVDADGQIDFPQLGTIKISGMTRSEVTKYIKNKLIESGIIKDPVVTVQFLNFKVSVLGEVALPGVIRIVSDRMSIFDALSSVGDLTIYGQRENVKIIREIDGEKIVATVDLRSINILDSPFYYLQQNDVIYVEPNKAKAGSSKFNSNREIGGFAPIISAILYITALAF